jgi:hypothetical protein
MGKRRPIYLLREAAKQFMERNYSWQRCDLTEALNDFSFGDGREEQYPIDEIQQLNLRRAPRLSDETGDGS